jgi:hypothetical protein
MKNKIYFYKIMVSVAVLLSVMCACTSGGGENGGWEGRNEDYKGSVYRQTESVPLYPQKKGGPELKFNVALLESGGDFQTLLSNALYDGFDCKDYVALRWETLKNMYAGMQDVPPPSEGGADYEASLNWNYSEIANGRFYSRLAVVKRERNVYTGGAHESSELNYFVFDTYNTKRVLLNDIIENDSMPELTKLIHDTLLADYSKKTNTPLTAATTLSDLGFSGDNVEASYDNFYLDKEGLGLVWNVYSIAPGYLGTIEIKLPAASINGMLNNLGTEIFSRL